MARGIRDIHLSRNAMLALVTVIGIVVIGLLVFFLVRGNGEDKSKEPSNTSTNERRPSHTPTQPPPGQHANNTDKNPTYPLPDAAQVASVTENARGFTAAWVRTGLPKDRWYAGLEKYCTKDFADQMSIIDPATSVPADSVTGDPKDVNVGYGSATANVPVDSGTLELEFRYVAGKWLIDSYSLDKRIS